ncbi:MAG TPA: prolyl oligopeptidase family serine peptidase [Tepidisphaeraceae bacterium]|nr:prolyl oligopeptidase family serine peptidase [Tepidisphaeraceae bacterium]
MPSSPGSPYSPRENERPAVPRLTERQRTAVALLLVGENDSVVAGRLGVHRNTISRWRSQNPVFIAELHRRQHEMFEALVGRVRKLAMKSMQTIDTALSDNGAAYDPAAQRLAVSVLRGTGAFKQAQPSGAQDLSAVLNAQVRATRAPAQRNEPVTDDERDAILAPWLADPEAGDAIDAIAPTAPTETILRPAYDPAPPKRDCSEAVDGRTMVPMTTPNPAVAPATPEEPTNYDEAKVPQYELPDALRAKDGSAVTSPAAWPKRREEILELFRTHMFGRSSGRPAELRFEVIETNEQAMDGAATLRRVAIHCRNGDRQHTSRLTLFLPNALRGRRAPVLLLINNRKAMHIDPTRATRSGFWPAEEMIARGYGAAAFQYGDVAPDDAATYRDGVMQLFDDLNQPRAGDGWGAIGAWAWGASRALDYLQTDDRVDGQRVAVIGHSRGGKTALWAAAQDERFAAAYSNESGCGGAAISRRMFGETIAKITANFPHWFAPNLNAYRGRDGEMPFDQHMLLDLLAPRLLYVASASDDGWADPKGEFLGLAHTSPVYGLWGEPAIAAHEWPAPERPLVRGRRGYHVRTGGHGMEPYDWGCFMDFLDRQEGWR